MGAALSFVWSGMMARVAGMYSAIAGGPDHNVTTANNVMTSLCAGTSAAQDSKTADEEQPRNPLSTGLMRVYTVNKPDEQEPELYEPIYRVVWTFKVGPPTVSF